MPTPNPENPHLLLEWDQYTGTDTFVQYSVYRHEAGETAADDVRIAAITAVATTSYRDYNIKSRTVYEYAVTQSVTIAGTTIESDKVENLPAAIIALNALRGYWRLGEASGVAIDSSGQGNNGTVTIGAGTRDAAALDDEGDGSIDFDGAATLVDVTDASAIQNIFDGGGSIFVLFNADSDGEGSAGRILDKRAATGNGWMLHLSAEAGGLVRIVFQVEFSGTLGRWQTAVNIPIGRMIALAITYDADATGNNPIFYVHDGTSLSILTVGSGLTEDSTPVGTRDTDVGTDLTIGNRPAADFTFDGRIDEVAPYTDILTATEAQNLIALARHRGQPVPGVVAFKFLFIHDVLVPGTNFAQFFTLDSGIRSAQDIDLRPIWGRQQPTAFIGEAEFHEIRVNGLPDTHSGKHTGDQWPDITALQSLQRTAGSVLCARFGFSGELFFGTLINVGRDNAEEQNTVNLDFTETFFQEAV